MLLLEIRIQTRYLDLQNGTLQLGLTEWLGQGLRV